MRTIRKLLLPALALGMLGLAVHHVVTAQQTPPAPSPPVEPTRSPYSRTLAAAGIVEPQSENIAIGSHLPGVVEEVFVVVGQEIKQGDPLFRLDDRQLQAERKYRIALLWSAEAQLSKLERMPRPEELPPSVAKVREAEANLIDKDELYRRAEKLLPSRAIADEDLILRRQATRMAREQLARVKAEDALLKAGAWEPDKMVARAAVEQARAADPDGNGVGAPVGAGAHRRHGVAEERARRRVRWGAAGAGAAGGRQRAAAARPR